MSGGQGGAEPAIVPAAPGAGDVPAGGPGPARGDAAWFAGFALGALVLYLFSPIREWGDSLHYALAIEKASPPALVESGHLLWRLLGALLWHAAQAVAPHARAFGALRLFTVVSSAAGVGLAAVFLRRRVGGTPAAAAAVLFATGCAYWSYACGACAYSATSALGVGAMLLAWPEEGRRAGAGRLVAAGLLQVAATLFWLPSILTAPAVGLAAGLERRDGRCRWRVGRTLAWGALFGAAVAAAYAAVWYGLAAGGPRFAAWLGSAAHGQAVGGGPLLVVRAAYGWTRLYWQAWRLGIDPEATGWAQLFGARPVLEWGMWKPAALYFLGAMALAAGARADRRGQAVTWLLLAAWFLPHLAFALLFKGADPERWLAAWAAVLVSQVAWMLGSRPGRVRRALVTATLALVAAVGIADGLGPRASVEHRPQMQLLRAAARHVRPGDMVYMGGEMDEGQLNRTVQTDWGFQWVYFTGAAASDVWTRPLDHFVGGEQVYFPEPGPSARCFVSEKVLAGIPEKAARSPGADERRAAIFRALPPEPLATAFEAGGERFFQLRGRPRLDGGP